MLAVTLARGGSKGIEKKNIRIIAGKPLIAWTIEEVQKCQHINKYIISTDDDEIADVAHSWGADVVLRPKELAQDDTPSILALKHATQDYFGDIAMIPCTNPLKTAGDIDGAVNRWNWGVYDSVIGVTEAYPVERIKTMELNLLRDTYPEPQDGQRQFLPTYYKRCGAFYITSKEWVERGVLFGHESSHGYVLPPERGVNIDNELDWAIAEMLLERRENAG